MAPQYRYPPFKTDSNGNILIALSGTQSSAITPLTSSGNHIATNGATSNIFSITMTENTTLDNPTNLVSGAFYTWIFTQGSGPYTLALGNDFKAAGGSAFVISTGNGAIDTLTALYNGTSLLYVTAQNFS